MTKKTYSINNHYIIFFVALLLLVLSPSVANGSSLQRNTNIFSVTGYTSDEGITLSILAESERFGIREIELPDGSRIKGASVLYQPQTDKNVTLKATTNDGSSFSEDINLSKIMTYSVDAHTVTNMSLEGVQNNTNDSIELKWDVPNAQEPYTYQVYSKKPDTSSYQSISAVDLNRKVRVLNVYPVVTPMIEYTTWDGTQRTLPRSASLEMWMEQPNTFHSQGFGMGLIDVDPISIAEFNEDSRGALTDSDGRWAYDAIFFGSWDTNNMQDITVQSRDTVIDFVDSGRGILYGHDTIDGYGNKNELFATLRHLGNILLRSHDDVGDFLAVGSNTVQIRKEGLLTRYPWNIGQMDTQLTIPETHTGVQIALGDIWMDFVGYEDNVSPIRRGPVVTAPNGQGTSNFYLTSWNNSAMIQTGHSNGLATPDEQKVLANTLFYLAQLTNDTSLSDRSAMDVIGPVFSGSNVTQHVSGGTVTVDFPPANDNQSTFSYYVEATGQDTGKVLRSESILASNNSGMAGYSYVIDNHPTTIPDNVVDTTTPTVEFTPNKSSNQYLHFVAVDKKGNISAPFHVLIDNVPPRVEVTRNVKNWTNQSLSLNYRVVDEASGVNYIILPDGTLISPENLFVNSAFLLDVDDLYERYGWDWTIPSGGAIDGKLWSPNETNIALLRNREAEIEIVEDDLLNRALKATSTGNNSGLSHASWGINFELTTGGTTKARNYVESQAGTTSLTFQVLLKANRPLTASMSEGGPLTESTSTMPIKIGTNWQLYTMNIPDYKGNSLGIWQTPGVDYTGTPQKGTEIYVAYPIVVPNRETQNIFNLDEWEDGGLNGENAAELDSEHWKRARVRQRNLHAIGTTERLHLQFNDIDYAFCVLYYDKDGHYTGEYKWYYNNGIIDIPKNAHYVRFYAGPADRKGDGHDSGISMDELENLNVRLYTISVARDSYHQLSGEYPAHLNGIYTFRAVDLAGNISHLHKSVNNIDKVSPSESSIDLKVH